MKRFLSVLLSAAGLISLIAGLSFNSWADWEANGENKSYIRENGNKVTGLMLIDSVRYKFDGDGNLQGEYNGWSQSRSTGDYYYYINGIMQTDYWYSRSNVWSYFGGDGKMVIGEKNIDGYDINFRANGTWDGVLPITAQEIHEKLLAEIPDIYGGTQIDRDYSLRIYATGTETAKEAVNRLYPSLPFFKFEECGNTFKNLKAAYDEIKGFKYEYATLIPSSFVYENTGTAFDSYGFYYYVNMQNNPQGFDYFDSYYTALNFAENVYAKYNISLPEEWDYDDIDFYSVAAEAYPDGEIDYSYFYDFYNRNKPYVHGEDSIIVDSYDIISNEWDDIIGIIYEEEAAAEDVISAEVDPLPIAANPYTGDGAEYIYRDPVNDLYYKPDVCARIFAYNDEVYNGGKYNLYFKDVYTAESAGYIGETADYYIQKGYTVTKNENKLSLQYQSYGVNQTAVINFINTDKSIRQLMIPYTDLRNNAYQYRVYIDDSFLSYYEDTYKAAGNKIKVYCYKDYDKVKAMTEKINIDGIIELIKRY